MSTATAPPASPQTPANHLWNTVQLVGVAAIAAPAPVLRVLDLSGGPHPHLEPLVESLIFGLAIFAAATLLVWASEVAEKLVSATLALAVLALIAVLPEYAVDLYFAWQAPDDPEAAGLALANMTGANRLLVGLAWPAVFFIFFLQRRRNRSSGPTSLIVGGENSIGLIFLGAATIYSFTIPLRQHLGVWDSAVLISIFVVYLILTSRAPPKEEAELLGPARTIDSLRGGFRWAAVIGLFAYAAAVIFASAEPFAEGLVSTGESFGISEFLLIQWVAPFASEAPEFILAAMLAARGRAVAGLTILISSKVNQWTLLVGSLPIAYAVSGQTLSPLPIDAHQTEEVFLTAAQSLFAVAILTSLSLNSREASIMFVLFAGQLVLPFDGVRWGFAAAYMLLALYWFFSERRHIGPLFSAAGTELRAGANPRDKHKPL